MEARSKRGMRVAVLICLLLLFTNVTAYAQIEKWIYQHDGPAKVYSVVYGADNNVYAVGYIQDATGHDFAVVSIDATGNENWVVTYNGSSDGSDEAYSLVYGDGNVYAAGTIKDTATLKDFTIISLNTSGSENWVYTYDGSASGADIANAIVYGDDGNIYAAGQTTGSGTNKDFVIVSVGATGSERWVYTYNGSASTGDIAYDVLYGDDGHIYATGYSTGTGTNKDITVISVDTAGNERWVYTFDGTISNIDEAYSIIHGADGYIYTTGRSRNSGDDITIVKLDTEGNEEWVYVSDTAGADNAYQIVYGSDNQLYVVGHIKGSWDDFAVYCVDTSGTKQWHYSRNGSSSSLIPMDDGNSIVYGADGNIYAAGFLQNGTKDLLVVCFDNEGNVNWDYEKNAGGNDIAEVITWGADDNLYIGGVLSGGFGVICIDPAPIPEIWSYPSFMMVMIDSGTTTTRELKIANIGFEGTTLDWTLSERPPVDWLDEDSTQGSLGSGDTVLITVTFDATELPPDAYYDTLEITCNDPTNPTKDIPVKLTIQDVGVEEYTDTEIEDRCELLSSFFNKAISLRFTNPLDTHCEIVLYDVLGARVYETLLISIPSLLHLDDGRISRLSNGVYFLSVSRVDKFYPVMKLIKF